MNTKIMSIFRWPIVAICSVVLASCDPGYSLLIYNRSAKEHKVCVIYNKDFATYYKPGDYHHSFCYKNYITISRLDTTQSQLLRKDSLAANWTTSYAFILPAKSKVVMESGLGVAPPNQDIVIDGGDTINTLKRRSWMYRIYRRPKLIVGGEYSLWLTD